MFSIDTGLWSLAFPWSLICTIAPVVGYAIGVKLVGRDYAVVAGFWMVVYYLIAFVLLVPIFPLIIPGGAIVGVILFVAAIMSEWRWEKKQVWPHCPICQYDLTGNASGVCPECGTRIETNDRAGGKSAM